MGGSATTPSATRRGTLLAGGGKGGGGALARTGKWVVPPAAPPPSLTHHRSDREPRAARVPTWGGWSKLDCEGLGTPPALAPHCRRTTPAAAPRVANSPMPRGVWPRGRRHPRGQRRQRPTRVAEVPASLSHAAVSQLCEVLVRCGRCCRTRGRSREAAKWMVGCARARRLPNEEDDGQFTQLPTVYDF